MPEDRFTRRDVAALAGTAAALLGATSAMAQTEIAGEISHANAAIHQEVSFTANPARLYRALTVSDAFDKVVRLSAAMNSGMKKVLGSAPTMIDAQPGGAFSLFGGYITGRFLELHPDTRIVQAWRAASWNTGLFSVAHFVLMPWENGTKLVFDHTGFPNEAAEHLAQGWHINYWKPLAKSLA
ncbi:MAG TPA: SRPBCC domain-containing protein [Rhizomicrobium sp.]|jgi:activator of HSP90 ATPase